MKKLSASFLIRRTEKKREQKNIWTIMLAMSLVLLLQPMTALAAEKSDGAETQSGETEAQNDVTYSLSDEQLDELLDFIKEKWDAGELEGEDAIRKAIEEGEEQFGVALQDSVKDQIADGMEKLDALGLDHDTVIDLAKKLYREHGDAIAENFQDLYEEYGSALTDSVEKVISEQVVEPAKEAAKEAVKNTAKTFWQDLKNSVVSFFRNIFS